MIVGDATGYKEWITPKYFVAIDGKDSYSVNGEINNKIALKRGSFKYDILDAIFVLGIGSLLYQTWSFYVCIIYIYLCINKIYIIYMIYEIWYIFIYGMGLMIQYTRYVIYIHECIIYIFILNNIYNILQQNIQYITTTVLHYDWKCNVSEVKTFKW